MSNITGRVGAVIGALGIIAFASPLAAQNPHHGQRMRVAAQWVERSQGMARQQMRWRRAAAWRMAGAGFTRGYAAGYGWRPFALRRPALWSSMVSRYTGPRRAMHRHPWRRPRVGRRYRFG